MVFLNRRDFATDFYLISPDGGKLHCRQLMTEPDFIRDVESGYEISVPSMALEMGMPANITSELLAYVGTGEIGIKMIPERSQRNIYSYDLKANQLIQLVLVQLMILHLSSAC